MIRIFTSATLNYLPKARVMVTTLKEFHPDFFVSLTLCDKLPSNFNLAQEPFDEVVLLKDFKEFQSPQWIFSHNIVELCTAVKGAAFKRLLTLKNTEAVLYLDPDIWVMSSIDEILKIFSSQDILLTPHLLEPETEEQEILNKEITTTLAHGIFNLGFLGIKNSKEGNRFANWWASRLHNFCYDDVSRGLFTDQRWCDLVPAFFPTAFIVRDKTCNVAPWNLYHRPVSKKDDAYCADGEKIKFFHFTGFDAGENYTQIVKKHAENYPEIISIWKEYEDLLLKFQNNENSSPAWLYESFDNGIHITDRAREVYRSNKDLQSNFSNPFKVGDNSYFQWCEQVGLLNSNLTDWSEIDSLKAEVANLQKSLEDTKNALANSDKIIIESVRAITEKEKTISELEKVIADYKKGLDQVFNSHSWKITSPLRWIWDNCSISPKKLITTPINFFIKNKVVISIVNTTFPMGSRRRKYADELFRLYFKYLGNDQSESSEKFNVEKHASIGDINFPKIKSNIPQVSIAILFHNQLQHTINCLNSIILNTKNLEEIEILLIDNGSEKKIFEKIKTIPNVKVIRFDENLGFVHAYNQSVKRAKADLFLFLNNDTLVCENWLPPLLEAIKDDNVAAVGSKLLYPNGTLQEAGSIVFRDGSAWNYGKGKDPKSPEYNFIREVDYCSAACLLVKKNLFQGFDEQFAPGYYEDADLCFSLRKAGYKVLYQPLSEVIHIEGASKNSSPTNMKSHMPRNAAYLKKKWKNELKKHFFVDDFTVEEARHFNKLPHLLICDIDIPQYDRDAGSLRESYLIKMLIELGYHITFISRNPTTLDNPYVIHFQQLGVEVFIIPTTIELKDFLLKRASLYKFIFLTRITNAQDVHSFILEHRERFDKNLKIIFDTIDLHFLRYAREAKQKESFTLSQNAKRVEKLEINIARKSDAVFTVSPHEEKLLREHGIYHTHIIPTIHECTPPINGFGSRKDLLFVANFCHPPNKDGVLWFVKECLPLIPEEIKLHICGSQIPPEVERLASEQIIIHGHVPDLTEFFESSLLSVAPLRFGAGVKGKINQSMSYGLPVATTSVGAEGMHLVHRKNAMIADTAEEFAKSILELYHDELLWNQLSQASLENIETHFHYDVVKEKLVMALAQF